MNQFQLYFELGIQHILDLNGTDHILFIVVMMSIYKIKDIKHILYVITSFTIAHSLTLLLSTLNLISIKPSLIELLIAITIVFTAVENIFWAKLHKKRVFLSGFFGLIHGLGFSNYLKAILASSNNIIFPLFSFNIGVEVGQIIIVVCYFILLELLRRFLKFNEKRFLQFVSLVIAITGIIWIFERL
jgi:hypothetical protein